MRTKIILISGVCAVVCIALLGCEKATPNETDADMQKICAKLDAINEMLDDGTKKLQCQMAGDTNGAAMWEAKRKEAYRRSQQ